MTTRATLQLKSKKPVSQEPKASEAGKLPVRSEASASASGLKPLKPSTPEMDRKRLENTLMNEQALARKQQDLAALRPIFSQYFQALPVLQPLQVNSEEGECSERLRPLSLGVRKEAGAWLSAQPQAQGCSSVVINTVVSDEIEAHVSQRAYLQGVLAMTERFDLQCNPQGVVTDKHRSHATKKLAWMDKKAPEIKPGT